MTEVRQRFEGMKLLRVELRDKGARREKHAICLCSCGREVAVQLARWQGNPPARCKRCNVAHRKRTGWNRY